MRSKVILGLILSVFGVAFAIGCASAQPHMRSALDHLLAARSELEAATPSKGGHRERAIELVNGAIEHVQAGIEFARYR
jgi:hypothetical protein